MWLRIRFSPTSIIVLWYGFVWTGIDRNGCQCGKIMVHSMNFVSVKMHDPPKKFFFAWNWWNTSQWHPITWIWPLECSRKSQFWRSLKWHSLCTVKVASKNCLSGLHFLELWLVSYHFGNLQSRPSKAH